MSHVTLPSAEVPSSGTGVVGGRRGWGWGGRARCHVWGSITALAALHLTNALLLSARDGPGAGVNVGSL